MSFSTLFPGGGAGTCGGKGAASRRGWVPFCAGVAWGGGCFTNKATDLEESCQIEKFACVFLFTWTV